MTKPARNSKKSRNYYAWVAEGWVSEHDAYHGPIWDTLGY
ncbi:hypothetical protein SAMN04488044_1903 [Cognatishimia maritima]|uniref:Uncharacterized protein n=1 Tax=Cognatishimia maritima TaxID=870908 RepID=A0A1M5Q808_9RHOB|nr:hypothetical protein SAMN04488044_1903 [Cognatishimia maritima]